MFLTISNNGKKVTNIRIKNAPKKSTKKNSVPENNSYESLSLSEKREKTLSHASKEGMYTAAKTGLVSNYVAPLAIHLGFSSFFIILLTAIPQLIGAVSQLFVEKLTHFFKSRYKLLIIAGKLEAYTWLLVVLIAAFSIKFPVLLILLVTLDAIFINIQSPIWTAILGDVIPENRVAKYFGRRNIMVGVSGLISTFLGGLILSSLTLLNAGFGFAILFFLSFLFAKFAVNNQTKIYDPAPRSMNSEKYSFFKFIKFAKKNNFGTFATFYSLYKFAVAVAGPFFAIYMLRELNFSYSVFALIVSVTVLSSMFATKHWINLIVNEGSKKTLKISSLLIPIIPLLWLFTTNWKLLLLVEFFSGLVWSGFNIAASTFIFEAVNPKQKVKFIAYNNVLAGLGTFLGTMLGLLINFAQLKFLGSVFLMIFLISAILRLVVALIFVNKIKEEKVLAINLKHETYKRFITMRPKEGVIFEVIGKTKKQKILKKEDKEKQKQKQKIRNVPSESPFKKKIKPRF